MLQVPVKVGRPQNLSKAVIAYIKRRSGKVCGWEVGPRRRGSRALALRRTRPRSTGPRWSSCRNFETSASQWSLPQRRHAVCCAGPCLALAGPDHTLTTASAVPCGVHAATTTSCRTHRLGSRSMTPTCVPPSRHRRLLHGLPDPPRTACRADPDPLLVVGGLQARQVCQCVCSRRCTGGAGADTARRSPERHSVREGQRAVQHRGALLAGRRDAEPRRH